MHLICAYNNTLSANLLYDGEWVEELTNTHNITMPGIRFVDIVKGPYPARSNMTADLYLFALAVSEDKEGGALHVFHID